MVDGFVLAYWVRPVIMRMVCVLLWTLLLFKTRIELGSLKIRLL